MGAPRQNTNAIRHGLRSSALPKEARYVEHATNKLRVMLESAALEQYGRIGPVVASCVNTAVRCERRAMLAERWFRLEIEGMSLADRLSLQREITQASQARDKAIQAIGLDANPTATSTWLHLRAADEDVPDRASDTDDAPNTEETAQQDADNSCQQECTPDGTTGKMPSVDQTTEGTDHEQANDRGVSPGESHGPDRGEPEAGD